MSTPSHASAHWSPRAVVTFSSLSTPLVPYPSSPTHLLLLSAAPHPTSGTTIYFSLSLLPPHLFSSLRRLLNIPRPISSPGYSLPRLYPPPPFPPRLSSHLPTPVANAAAGLRIVNPGNQCQWQAGGWQDVVAQRGAQLQVSPPSFVHLSMASLRPTHPNTRKFQALCCNQKECAHVPVYKG